MSSYDICKSLKKKCSLEKIWNGLLKRIDEQIFEFSSRWQESDENNTLIWD